MHDNNITVNDSRNLTIYSFDIDSNDRMEQSKRPSPVYSEAAIAIRVRTLQRGDK